MQAFQEIKADFDFLNRIRSQRNTNGIADTLHQQQTEPSRTLHSARSQSARFGDAQMQRLVDFSRDGSIGLDRHKHIGRLHADLKIFKALIK